MTRLSRRSIAAVAVTAGLVFATGCGSSSSTTTTGSQTSAALSAQQLREQADAICKDVQTRVDALGTPNSASDLKDLFTKGVALGNEQLTRLKTLVPPADLKAKWDEAMSLQQQQIDILTKAQAQITAGEDPLTVVTSLTPQMDPLQARAKQAAVELGLTECGKDSGSGTDTTTTPTTAPTDTTAVTTDATTTEAAPGGVVTAAVFAGDVQKFAQALTQFGLTLQSAAASPEALKSRVALLRNQLDSFDRVTARMDGYTVDTSSLETKRAAIVAASPDVSRLGRDLLDAAQAGDGSKVQSIATEFKAALEKLSKAAQS